MKTSKLIGQFSGIGVENIQYEFLRNEIAQHPINDRWLTLIGTLILLSIRELFKDFNSNDVLDL